jgi:hypothetical protein
MSILDEDIDIFFDDFSVEAAYTEDDTEVTFNVLFDTAYIDALIGGMSMIGGSRGSGVAAKDITALCKTSDVSSLSAGDTFDIDNVSYVITHPPRDHGNGFTTLILGLA